MSAIIYQALPPAKDKFWIIHNNEVLIGGCGTTVFFSTFAVDEIIWERVAITPKLFSVLQQSKKVDKHLNHKMHTNAEFVKCRNNETKNAQNGFFFILINDIY
jgi:hypothetical protein